MEMKKINAGKLRAIGYDARERILRVELENGTAIEYSGVGNEVWRRFSTSGAAWSFYRDNIEEEFAGTKSRVQQKSNRQSDCMNCTVTKSRDVDVDTRLFHEFILLSGDLWCPRYPKSESAGAESKLFLSGSTYQRCASPHPLGTSLDLKPASFLITLEWPF